MKQSSLFSPAVLVDLRRLESNLDGMQAQCTAHGVELRPHIKTHKSVRVARLQLEKGAAGLTCAKLGEAEALLPAFEGRADRELFIAHSVVSPLLVPRLRALRSQLTELVLAVTSLAQLPHLAALTRELGPEPVAVMMAVDTGLHREGARGLEGARQLARAIEAEPSLLLKGLYTHEGHFYGEKNGLDLAEWHGSLLAVQQAVQEQVGRPLKLWPGCSVTAFRAAALPGVDAVRPGSYVYGDLSLCETNDIITPQQVALTILATVLDRPEPGLALLDAGSKTLSSDKSAAGIFARCDHGAVTRVSEEHGFLTGPGVDELQVGQRINLIPAHVCPILNLHDTIQVTADGQEYQPWPVEARGKVN